jgi:hypothetical protein
MPYAAYAVAGSEFKFTYGSPAALTTIAGVTNVAFGGGERTDIDVTAIDDEDQYTIGGRRARKTLTYQIYYDPADAGHQALLANYNAADSTAVACSVVLADAGAAALTFDAYVRNFAMKLDVDGAIAADVEMVLTTNITTTP